MKNSFEKVIKIMLIILCLPFAMLIIISIHDGTKKRDTERNMEKHISEYCKVPNLKESIQSPYIVGKVVVVDKSSNKIDKEIMNYMFMKSEMKANNPNDVGTIIWISCRHDSYGSYVKTGTKGYKNICEVTVIDKSQSIIVDKKQFEAEPPSSITYKTADPKPGDVYAGRPIHAIVNYINKLPQR